MKKHEAVRPIRAQAMSVVVLFALSVLLVAQAAAQAAPATPPIGYQKPPKAVQAILDAPPTPAASVSPARDRALLIEPQRYPGIAELSQPMLRLAGLRINPATNGPHLAPRIVSFTLKNLADGSEKKVSLPANPLIGRGDWSPDGKHFFFTNTTATGVELWVGDSATAATRKIAGVALNAVFGQPCQWEPDSRTLLCRTLAAGRGKPPERSLVPAGPNIQESYGRSAPVPTFQDLLQDTHDEKLFEYYATSQLARVDTTAGKSAAMGKPGVIVSADPAPDEQHTLVMRLEHPYSYWVTAQRFPREVEVWDRAGRVVYKVASLPLAENVPLGGVPTGPRNVGWRATAPATLVWVEAQDDGDPKKKVAHRDRVMWIAAPFTGKPAELLKTEHRFAGLEWGERGDMALVREFDRDRLWGRAWLINPHHPDLAPRLVWDMSTQDRYRNPGQPVTRTLPNGATAIAQDGDAIFLSGAGATPEGDRPFLDRFDLKALKAERLFRSGETSYESFVALLAADASKFLTRYESTTEPPNYYVRTASSETRKALTSFPDPAPQLRQIKKELVKYKRADGVELSFTVYLPPDYKPGERRPGVVWAYPLEFTDASVAGQVSGSPNRFTTITGYSHLFFALAGYVVLDNATMPVVGDPETVNNTYVEQIVSSARAAIEKADQMGVIDPARVGVGGHSYGAFMTANLLAHSDLFRAGIARSGAYNRTLTPFGFQSERRTLWQAMEMYIKVSPFLVANRINEPILLIHGEADNNTGTFPIQSERMYHAVKGNGGSVRYVTLPHESHGYSARESTEHVLWEMLNWFEKHVKNAGPRQQVAAN